MSKFGVIVYEGGEFEKAKFIEPWGLCSKYSS